MPVSPPPERAPGWTAGQDLHTAVLPFHSLPIPFEFPLNSLEFPLYSGAAGFASVVPVLGLFCVVIGLFLRFVSCTRSLLSVTRSLVANKHLFGGVPTTVFILQSLLQSLLKLQFSMPREGGPFCSFEILNL